jgi:YVTN family beta-propeller protein
MKSLIKIGVSSLIASLLLVGCGNSSTVNSQNQHNKHSSSVAYFGDKENNLVVIVDVENMKVIDTIATGHEKTYAVEEIKTLKNRHSANRKMYIDNRGSDAIDVFDPATNNIIKTIKLDFHPRSIDIEKESGLVAVSGTDKAMTAIIDSSTDRVIATVGDSTTTYPTTSGHSYISSGTLASGHPHWLNREHFVLIDRQNRKIITYKLIKNSDNSWSTIKVNELKTPSPVHNLIPPEIHGKHGQKAKHGGREEYLSTIFYATAEGAKDIYPSVLKLEFKSKEGLSLVEELKIKREGVDVNIMGVHHLNFLKNQKSIYVGSDEGNLFIIDYSSTPMKITKIVEAGKGAGHTYEMKHNSIAVVINHKDSFISLMNTKTDEKIADIKVSTLDSLDGVQTQSHPQYHFSKDGRYFYLFLTEEGALVKIDLTEKRVIKRLNIGGKLAMGTFIN